MGIVIMLHVVFVIYNTPAGCQEEWVHRVVVGDRGAHNPALLQVLGVEGSAPPLHIITPAFSFYKIRTMNIQTGLGGYMDACMVMMMERFLPLRV